ncbi:MAG: phosphoribosyltransferase family protein [Anaerosomatales bacterium]|nr:phosphoribosyltransferase family protein [Anaerosomatales bacterium]MDT8433643.1 phosphoribosyltransferase family protein [Anaerosomatales bacterium]
MYRDRHDAGRRLAEELVRFAGDEDVVVLGIPRGGVIVGGEIAGRLDLALDVVVASKIGAPHNAEYAIGAVDADGRVTPNPQAGYDAGELEHLARPVRDKIRRRIELYRGGEEPLDLEGATAIVTDDGIATGLTALAAVRYVRAQGVDRIVLAVPVIASGTMPAFEREVDEIVAPEQPTHFMAVGQFYRNFPQTSDDEVLEVLREFGYGD